MAHPGAPPPYPLSGLFGSAAPEPPLKNLFEKRFFRMKSPKTLKLFLLNVKLCG
jgi:hypothetical protein